MDKSLVFSASKQIDLNLYGRFLVARTGDTGDQLLTALEKEFNRIKLQIDYLSSNRDVETADNTVLPEFAYLKGIANYPLFLVTGQDPDLIPPILETVGSEEPKYLFSLGDNEKQNKRLQGLPVDTVLFVKGESQYILQYDVRRFLRYAEEINKYKGTLYCVELIVKQIYNMQGVYLREMYSWVFGTYNNVLKENSPVTMDTDLNTPENQDLEAIGLPVHFRLFSNGSYDPRVLLIYTQKLDGLTVEETQNRYDLYLPFIRNFVPVGVIPCIRVYEV